MTCTSRNGSLAAKPLNTRKVNRVLGIGSARTEALVSAFCAERGVLQRDRFFLSPLVMSFEDFFLLLELKRAVRPRHNRPHCD